MEPGEHVNITIPTEVCAIVRLLRVDTNHTKEDILVNMLRLGAAEILRRNAAELEHLADMP